MQSLVNENKVQAFVALPNLLHYKLERLVVHTLKPLYNELEYNEISVITKEMKNSLAIQCKEHTFMHL